MSKEPKREINPRGSGARLREELVDAALRLLEATRGDADLTLRGVAREAGVAAPSIYSHFANVDQLGLAVLDRVVAIIGERVFSIARMTPPGRPRIGAVCTAYVTWATDNPGQYTAVMQGKVLRMVEQGPRIGREHSALMVSSLRAILAEANPALRDPEFAACHLWSSIHGIASLRIAKPYNEWPALERQLTAAIDSALDTA